LIQSPDKPVDCETSVIVDSYLSACSTINAVLTPYALTKHFSIPVYLNETEKPQLALLDSGAMGNFIHDNVVEALGLIRIPRRPLPLLDVKGINIGSLDFQVKTSMKVRSHEEEIVFDIAPIGSHRLILGLPWLEAHDPTIKWSTGHVQFNSPHCNIHCLPQPHDIFARQLNQVTPVEPIDLESVGLYSMEPDFVEIFAVDLMPSATEGELRGMIPEQYHDFLDVFDPTGPMRQLPPLRPGYDFEIPLDPNKPLPKPA